MPSILPLRSSSPLVCRVFRNVFEVLDVATHQGKQCNPQDLAEARQALEQIELSNVSKLSALSHLTVPTGENLIVFNKIFGHLLAEESAKQDREAQTIVTLLRSRGEAKARMAYKELEYNNLMSKSAGVQKPSKSKRNVSDAFWWSRPVSAAHKEMHPHTLSRSLGSLEFKTPKEPTITLNLAGCNARKIGSANRSFVFEISTPEGIRHVVQATSKQDCDSWMDTINKASEMAVMRRKTFVAATITEIAEPLPSVLPQSKLDMVTDVGIQTDQYFRHVLARRLTLEEELEKDYGPNHSPTAVPVIVEACINEIERRCLSEPGLYRIPGSLSRVDALLRSFATDKSPDLSEDSDFVDPSSITSALKKWLASMPESVITTRFYDDFILADSEYLTPNLP